MRPATATRRAALASLLALVAGGAGAQSDWPSKPVTIVVPFAPGGGTDIGTRVVAQKLSQLWGQSVVVDNRGGAGGNVGLDLVARARPDGYTLVTGNVGTQSINPTLYKKLSYNPDTAESGSWLGLLAPAGTPQAITDKVAQDVARVLAMPDVQQQLLAQGAVARFGSAADFSALIANDRRKYARIITENNLSAD